jgi:exonuclease III
LCTCQTAADLGGWRFAPTSGSQPSDNTSRLLRRRSHCCIRVRELDAWGTTDAQFGGYKASGRTREEANAFDMLLKECALVDGFRTLHPHERSATCWAQKKAGVPEQREHWKRYDYVLASKALLSPEDRGVSRPHSSPKLVAVRHLKDAFEGGRPDHLPVESVVSGLF